MTPRSQLVVYHRLGWCFCISGYPEACRAAFRATSAAWFRRPLSTAAALAGGRA